MNEKKRTAINLAAKIISYSATLLISFFLTPYLVNNIGKEAYSFYPLANNFTSYMSVLTTALNSMASRYITISLEQKREELANTYFISILLANIILSLILIIPLSAIVVFLQYILDIPFELIFTVKLLFILVFISMIVNLITNVFGVACFSKNRLELASIQEIVVGGLKIGLYVLFFTCFQPNLIFVGVVAVIIALATGGIQFYYTKKLLPFIKYKRRYFNWSAIKEVLSSGIWNSVNQIGVILLSTIGLMMCNKLYGTAEGGDYSIALTIPTFINGIVNMLSSVFLPGLTIKYAHGNKDLIVHHVQNAQNIIGLIVNIPIAAFMAIGVNFFRLWTPTVDPYKLQRLSVLAIGYLLVTSVAWPISNLNTVMNKVKIPALVMLGTGLLNVVLIFISYWCMDWLGAYSIPLWQLILFVLNRVLFVGVYAARCLGVKKTTFYPPFVRNLIGAAIIFLISFAVNKLLNPNTWFMLVLECCIIGLLGLVLNSLIILKPSGIKSIISGLFKKKNFKDKNGG